MEDVESFSLDHTKVSAPYVRKCASLYGKKGDIVEKYDIRFFTPNSEFLTTTAMHSVEHLMALDGILTMLLIFLLWDAVQDTICLYSEIIVYQISARLSAMH